MAVRTTALIRWDTFSSKHLLFYNDGTHISQFILGIQTGKENLIEPRFKHEAYRLPFQHSTKYVFWQHWPQFTTTGSQITNSICLCTFQEFPSHCKLSFEVAFKIHMKKVIIICITLHFQHTFCLNLL